MKKFICGLILAVLGSVTAVVPAIFLLADGASAADSSSLPVPIVFTSRNHVETLDGKNVMWALQSK